MSQQNTPRRAFDLAVQADYDELEGELLQMKESVKRGELELEMKMDTAEQLRQILAVHELMQRLTKERVEQLEITHAAASNNLDYKRTLLETFREGLEVKEHTLGLLEHEVQAQTRKLDILTTRRNVAKHCLDAREKQILLLSEHVAGTLEDRSKQKEQMAQYHAQRLKDNERELKVQTHRAKWDRILLGNVFKEWVVWKNKSMRAKRIMRGTFMVWKMRRMKTIHHACLVEWRDYVRKKKQARDRLVEIANSTEIDLARVFRAWRGFVAERNQRADDHFRQAIVGKLFRGWRVVADDKVEWRNKQLVLHRQVQLERTRERVARVFKEWRFFAHTTSMNKRALRNFDGQLVVAKMFRAWRQLAKGVHDKRARDDDVRRARMAFLFTKWRDYTRKRKLMRRAMTMIQQPLVAKAYRAMHHHMLVQRTARKAAGRLQHPLAARAWAKWRAQIKTDKAIRGAVARINAPTLRNALDEWRSFTKASKKLKGVMVRLQHPELGRAFNSWRVLLQEKKRWQVVAKVFNQARMAQCFAALRIAADEGKELAVFARRRAPVFTLRYYFDLWAQHVRANRLKRHAIERMKMQHAQAAFTYWRRKVHLIRKCREAVNRLRTPATAKAFAQWRQFTQQRRKERQRRHDAFAAPLRDVWAQWRAVREHGRWCEEVLVLPSIHAPHSRPMHIADTMAPPLLPLLTELVGEPRSVMVSSGLPSLAPRHGHRCVGVHNNGVVEVALNGVVYVFGGLRDGKFLGDLMGYDTYGALVDFVHPSATTPPPRAFHSITLAHPFLVLYGGFHQEPGSDRSDTAVVFADVWTYSLTTHTWRNCKPQVDKGLASGRCCHAAAAGGGRGGKSQSVWVFGGFDEDKLPCNTMLRYSPAKNLVTEVFCHGSAPSARTDSACTTDAHNHGMYVFGGSESAGLFSSRSSSLNDLYHFVFSTHTWVYIETRGPPSARQGSVLCTVGDGLFVVGGSQGDDGVPVSESAVHCFHPNTAAWTTVPVEGGLPARSEVAGCAMGACSVVLVGGTSHGSKAHDHNDFVRLDLQRDTLRLLRVGGVDRLASLWDRAPEKAVDVLTHVSRNLSNRQALARTRLFPALVRAAQTPGPLQPHALRVLANFATPALVDDTAVAREIVWQGLLPVIVATWRARVPSLRTPCSRLLLWVASLLTNLPAVLSHGVGVSELLALATSPCRRVALQAHAMARAWKVELAVHEADGRVQMASLSAGFVEGLLAVFVSSKSAPVAMERAAEALVEAMCVEGGKDVFAKHFAAEGCEAVVGLLESRRVPVQRCGLSLARWLAFDNPAVVEQLAKADALASVSRLLASADTSIAMSAYGVLRVLKPGAS